MLTYSPGDSPIHRLDPRSKLCFQFGFAIAALFSSGPRLAALFVVAALAVSVTGLSPLRALWSYRVVLVVLAIAPLIAGFTPGPPWFRLDRAAESLRAVARVVPILLLSAAYIRATPVRETRAAIQRTIPGRAGQLLGTGVALTIRFVPVLREDVREVRDAIAARGGDRRPVHERAGRLVPLSIRRALARSDELAVALEARCFAWNPTLPRLQFSRPDYLVVGAAVVLTVSPLVSG
ncbi:energy-coupling factor transporter transmembrane protein EcfT [Halovenus sp. WSH3]|uniref:Energy-coupling factor transporter transmembrane protein EcfT n=1 Tax=Halovenus carboxidivorans TaxID=2692199 RepID=A0A6B0TIY9_9EURY|nr:energy-coupling factor transporter transmembrane component T [Halovenus carboxidivorans]MXR53169.1 energy-coupling factor transporter transmembrane protein EcfT [Halovenus carboxidivorans]